MASATIRLMVDPTTGKRTVTIAYGSDADALPHEHEEAHRQIVEKLFEGGIAKAGDTIVVERESTGTAGDLPAAAAESADEKRAAREGS